MIMQKTLCDRTDCNMEVKDKRKITVGRMNPWYKYASFHLCSLCEKMLFIFIRGWMKGDITTGPSGKYELFPDRDYNKDYWKFHDEVVGKINAGEPVIGE